MDVTQFGPFISAAFTLPVVGHPSPLMANHIACLGQLVHSMRTIPGEKGFSHGRTFP